jgi:hypothetical protein
VGIITNCHFTVCFPKCYSQYFPFEHPQTHIHFFVSRKSILCQGRLKFMFPINDKTHATKFFYTQYSFLVWCTWNSFQMNEEPLQILRLLHDSLVHSMPTSLNNKAQNTQGKSCWHDYCWWR